MSGHPQAHGIHGYVLQIGNFRVNTVGTPFMCIAGGLFLQVINKAVGSISTHKFSGLAQCGGNHLIHRVVLVLDQVKGDGDQQILKLRAVHGLRADQFSLGHVIVCAHYLDRFATFKHQGGIGCQFAQFTVSPLHTKVVLSGVVNALSNIIAKMGNDLGFVFGKHKMEKIPR